MIESTAINCDVEKTAMESSIEQQQHQVNHQELSEEIEKSTAQDESAEDGNVEYPSGAKVVLIMVSLFLAVFLVALVSRKPHLISSLTFHRIGLSPQQRSLKSPMTFTLCKTSDGTAVPTC
jgi:hypothetical protein